MTFRYGVAKAATPTKRRTYRKTILSGGVFRRAALHPVLPLRAHLQRGDGVGALG